MTCFMLSIIHMVKEEFGTNFFTFLFAWIEHTIKLREKDISCRFSFAREGRRKLGSGTTIVSCPCFMQSII